MRDVFVHVLSHPCFFYLEIRISVPKLFGRASVYHQTQMNMSGSCLDCFRDCGKKKQGSLIQQQCLHKASICYQFQGYISPRKHHNLINDLNLWRDLSQSQVRTFTILLSYLKDQYTNMHMCNYTDLEVEMYKQLCI